MTHPGLASPGGLAAADPAWLVATLLVSARLASLALLSPALGGASVPVAVRAMLVMALSAVLAWGWPLRAEASAALLSSPMQLAWAMARELVLGGALALGVSASIALFTSGARVLDLQVGFGLGQFYDPSSRAPMPVLSALAGWVAIATFFLVDAHHALLRGLALSFESVPPGGAWRIDGWLDDAVRALSMMTSLGFALFAPVVLVLLAVELALAFASRSLPQMNMLVLGMPVKAMVGLLALAALASASRWPLERLHATGLVMWSALWR